MLKNKNFFLVLNYFYLKFARDSQNTQTQTQNSKNLKLKPKLKPVSIFECIWQLFFTTSAK